MFGSKDVAESLLQGLLDGSYSIIESTLIPSEDVVVVEPVVIQTVNYLQPKRRVQRKKRPIKLAQKSVGNLFVSSNEELAVCNNKFNLNNNIPLISQCNNVQHKNEINDTPSENGIDISLVQSVYEPNKSVELTQSVFHPSTENVTNPTEHKIVCNEKFDIISEIVSHSEEKSIDSSGKQHRVVSDEFDDIFPESRKLLDSDSLSLFGFEKCDELFWPDEELNQLRYNFGDVFSPESGQEEPQLSKNINTEISNDNFDDECLWDKTESSESNDVNADFLEIFDEINFDDIYKSDGSGSSNCDDFLCAGIFDENYFLNDSNCSENEVQNYLNSELFDEDGDDDGLRISDDVQPSEKEDDVQNYYAEFFKDDIHKNLLSENNQVPNSDEIDCLNADIFDEIDFNDIFSSDNSKDDLNREIFEDENFNDVSNKSSKTDGVIDYLTSDIFDEINFDNISANAQLLKDKEYLNLSEICDERNFNNVHLPDETESSNNEGCSINTKIFDERNFNDPLSYKHLSSNNEYNIRDYITSGKIFDENDLNDISESDENQSNNNIQENGIGSEIFHENSVIFNKNSEISDENYQIFNENSETFDENSAFNENFVPIDKNESSKIENNAELSMKNDFNDIDVSDIDMNLDDIELSEIIPEKGKGKKGEGEEMKYVYFDPILECNFCERKFKTELNLKFHLTLHENDSLLCKFCNKHFKKANLLKLHLIKHTNKSNLKCKHCSKCFGNNSSLKRHEIIHTTEKPFKCNYCDKSYRQNNDLKIHLKKHNNERMSCKICNEILESNWKLRTHMENHKGKAGEEGGFVCYQCSKMFKDKQLLKRHLFKHDRQSKIKCDICNKFFATNTILKNHLKTHVERYKCKLCDKVYISKRSFMDHELSHKNMKYVCRICLKYFRQKDRLTCHMKIHTDDWLQCNVCLKKFHLKESLIKHLKNHDNLKEMKARTQCKCCFKWFGKMSDLTKHMVIHTGQSNYNCKLCYKPFTTKYNLMRHEKTMHKEFKVDFVHI